MSWIDSHCHLADPRCEASLDTIAARSRAAGVEGWVQGGIEPADWDRQIALKQRLGDGVVLSFGLHPWWVAQSTEAQVREGLHALETRLHQAAGLGELGMDLLPRFAESAERQAWAFRQQLGLARGYAKPLVLHVVHAHEPALAALGEAGPFPAGGLVHAFSASRETAERYLAHGFLISVGSAVLRDGFHALKKALPHLPEDRLVVETDSPDGLPGVSNEPARLVEVAETVARLRGETAGQVLDRSTRLIRTLFGL